MDGLAMGVMLMNHSAEVLVIVAGVVILAAIAAYFYSRQKRSQLLRRRFGPEYDRVVRQEQSVRRAEGVLAFREQARETLDIRPLSREDQAAFANRWKTVQRTFVDDPSAAVLQADQLITEVMRQCGYPVASFERRAEIASVDYPLVVQNYRAAHEVALRQGKGEATTEDLRKAMIHYRSLFDELLNHSLVDTKETG
jgi:hypothetical protein